MSGLGDLALVSGALQLTVPSYSLRLVRRFGTGRVGWFVVAAFASLAALHLLKPLRPMDMGPASGMSLEIVFAMAAALLLIGLCHLETLLLERQQAERAEQRLRAKWESRVQEKTADLAQANQELLGRIARMEQAASALKESEAEARLLLASDISRRRQRERELCEAQKHEVTSRLAGGVAHHLNNPLGIISGYASLLLHRSQDEQTAEPLKQICAAVNRAAGLSRQLLITSGQFALRQELLDLDGLMTNLEPMLRRLVGNEIALQRSGAPDLPRILADVRLVEHIIINLVLNARDAMPRGGSLAISTDIFQGAECQSEGARAAKPARVVRLTVRDTGCGIAPEAEAYLFEPFFSTRGVGKGRGLGLASVQGAVKQQGGWIEYTTQPGVGTEFRVFFPAASTVPAPGESDFRRWIRH